MTYNATKKGTETMTERTRQTISARLSIVERQARLEVSLNQETFFHHGLRQAADCLRENGSGIPENLANQLAVSEESKQQMRTKIERCQSILADLEDLI